MRLSWESYQYFKSWQDFVQLPATPATLNVRECGGILLRSPNSNAFIDAVLLNARRYGIPAEEWDRPQTEARVERIGWDVSKNYCARDPLADPLFGTPDPGPGISGSVYMPQTAYVADPRLAAMQMREAAERTGRVSFHFRRRVTCIRYGPSPSSGHFRVVGVDLDDGTKYATPCVVNAAGPQSYSVTEMAFSQRHSTRLRPNDMHFMPRPLRAEVAFLDAPEGVNLDRDGLITGDFDLGIYLRPDLGNRLLVSGIEPACDALEWLDTGAVPLDHGWASSRGTSDGHKMYDPNDTILSEAWERHVYRAALRMPGLAIPTSARHRRGVVSSYDVTPDWTPILDGSSRPGYYMAIGTSGNQFKNAPVIGDMMARLVEYCEGARCAARGNDSLRHDVESFKYPMRYCHVAAQGEEAGAGGVNASLPPLDLRVFSRLRTPYVTTTSVVG